MASSSRSSGDAAVSVEALGYVWPGRISPALVDVDLRVRRGECVFVAGPSGAGKTTLLRALAGVLPGDGRLTGQVEVRGGRPALLFQNVETQLLCTRVDEEVDFGLALRGLAPEQRRARGASALGALGLAGFGPRPVDDLSAGERQRVVLAALLALEPGLLLLDEPTSQLDPAGREALSACLLDVKRAGHAVVVADHRLEPFATLADRRIGLKEGRLVPADAPVAPGFRARPGPVPRGRAALELVGVHVGDASGRALLREISLSVAPGERVHLLGRNGAGKTTLLRAAAGLVRPTRGRVRAAGAAPPSRAGSVALLFQDCERNLFERTVAEEVAFTPRRMGWPPDRVARRVDELLAAGGLAHAQDRSPLRLSFGEQHRVALASVLAPSPALLLLDEPFAGLDLASRAAILEWIAREQRRAGTAVVLASHDPLPVRGWAHRCLRLEEGRLADD